MLAHSDSTTVCGNHVLQEGYVGLLDSAKRPEDAVTDARGVAAEDVAQEHHLCVQNDEGKLADEGVQAQIEKVFNRLGTVLEKEDFIIQLEESRSAEQDRSEEHLMEALQGEYVVVDDDTKDAVEAGYVVLDRQEVIEAMASFIAAYLSTVPEARALEPHKLRSALHRTFQDLKSSRWKQVWAWGNTLYRCSAIAYSAFTLYENPWLVRAMVTALWAGSQVMLRTLV